MLLFILWRVYDMWRCLTVASRRCLMRGCERRVLPVSPSGTSVASPIIASVYALAGNASIVTYGSYPYSHSGSLNDVTSGSNGSCGGSYLCTAGTGYDGPTGLGTPNGTGGF